jgi:hypothetical protein
VPTGPFPRKLGSRHSDDVFLLPALSMASRSRSGSSSADFQLVSEAPTQWRPILQHSTQIVLYHPTSHALTIRPALAPPSPSPHHPTRCPYCARPFDDADGAPQPDASSARAPNYFQLLQIANAAASRPPTPPLADAAPLPRAGAGTAEGYFEAFFVQVRRLGMGAGGTVFLCQVRLRPSSCRSVLTAGYSTSSMAMHSVRYNVIATDVWTAHVRSRPLRREEDRGRRLAPVPHGDPA